MEISQQVFRSLGMTLVHSLWQGAIIAALILFMLSLGKKSDARYRYGVLVSGIMLQLASFIATFIFVLQTNRLPEILQDTLTQLQIQQILEENALPSPVSLTGKISGYLEPLYPAIAMGWIAGFAFMSLKILGGSLYGRIRLQKALIAPDMKLQEIFDALKESMHLPGVTLFVSQRMISPLVTGVFKPMVVIPLAAISGLSTDQIRTILVHELAHITRYDHVMIFIQAIARQVLFFHPLTWFLIPEIDRERENCCDDFVIRSQNSPINYIKALAMIQEMNLKGIPANNLAGKRSKHLLSRISRLIKPEIRHSGAFRLTLISVLIAAISLSSMALIVSDHHDVKNSSEDIPAILQDTIKKQTVQADKEGIRKKMKIVYTDDSITEMTVNGKKLTREEMHQYAEQIRKMQHELQASQEELYAANQKLMEAQKELEIAQRNMVEIQIRDPELFSFNLEKKDFENMPEFHFNPDDFKEFDSKDLEKFREEMEKFREKQQDYWEMHQDEWKIQVEKFREQAEKQKEYWKLHKDEWEEQMKKAREESLKGLEELRKNGLLPPGIDLDSDKVVPRIHGIPPVPDPDMEIDIEVDIPEVPEVPENPASTEPGEEHDLPADTGKSESNDLNNKLRELEKE